MKLITLVFDITLHLRGEIKESLKGAATAATGKKPGPKKGKKKATDSEEENETSDLESADDGGEVKKGKRGGGTAAKSKSTYPSSLPPEFGRVIPFSPPTFFHYFDLALLRRSETAQRTPTSKLLLSSLFVPTTEVCL
jgi:hypothetical protein